MVIGLANRERGHHNLAADAFGAIRAAGGPLAPIAGYYEAEQDWERGRAPRGYPMRQQLRSSWPSGPHAGDCLRIVALAHAAPGDLGAARSAAPGLRQEHPLGTIAERIELALGTRLATTDPAAAVPILRRAHRHPPGAADLAGRRAAPGRSRAGRRAERDDPVRRAVPDEPRDLAAGERPPRRGLGGVRVAPSPRRRRSEPWPSGSWPRPSGSAGRPSGWDFLVEQYGEAYAADGRRGHGLEEVPRDCPRRPVRRGRDLRPADAEETPDGVPVAARGGGARPDAAAREALPRGPRRVRHGGRRAGAGPGGARSSRPRSPR